MAQRPQRDCGEGLRDDGAAVKFSSDKTRAIANVSFGVACYLRVGSDPPTPEATNFEYRHQGVVRCWADGERWLAGEMPATFKRIFGDGGMIAV